MLAQLALAPGEQGVGPLAEEWIAREPAGVGDAAQPQEHIVLFAGPLWRGAIAAVRSVAVHELVIAVRAAARAVGEQMPHMADDDLGHVGAPGAPVIFGEP